MDVLVEEITLAFNVKSVGTHQTSVTLNWTTGAVLLSKFSWDTSSYHVTERNWIYYHTTVNPEADSGRVFQGDVAVLNLTRAAVVGVRLQVRQVLGVGFTNFCGDTRTTAFLQQLVFVFFVSNVNTFTANVLVLYSQREQSNSSNLSCPKTQRLHYVLNQTVTTMSMTTSSRSTYHDRCNQRWDRCSLEVILVQFVLEI